MRGAAALLALAALLAGCDTVPGGGVNGQGGLIPVAAGTPRPERLVLHGGHMTFDQCVAQGGLIIQDKGNPMMACDPTVDRAPPPANEFDHPSVEPGKITTPAS